MNHFLQAKRKYEVYEESGNSFMKSFILKPVRADVNRQVIDKSPLVPHPLIFSSPLPKAFV